MDIRHPSPPLRDRLLGPAHGDNRAEEDVFVKPRRRRAGPALEGTHALIMPPEPPPPQRAAPSRSPVVYDRDGRVHPQAREKGRRHDNRL